MRWISRFLGLVLSTALVVSAGAWVLTQTIGNDQYLVRQAEQAKVAEQVATGLPALLAGLTPTPDDTRVILEEAITLAFIDEQLEMILPQLVRYYNADGPVPQLDLRELEQRIEATGYPVPSGLAPILDGPQAITAGRLDGPLMTTAELSRLLAWLAPLVALGAAVLIAALARQRRWLVLAGSTLSAAVGVAVLAAIAYLPPALIASTLNTSPASPLAPAVRSLADAVARDQSHRLLWLAGGLAGFALVLWVVHMVTKLRQRSQKKEH